jgi:RES domain
LILHRVFPRDPRAAPTEPGGSLFWPRGLQGYGRHDNPELYACIYASETRVSPVAEVLAPFRGAGEVAQAMLERNGRPLALAAIEVPDELRLIDLDDPRTLASEALRPSQVATRRWSLTQAQAARLFESHERAAGLRWWSSLESLWINVTLFDRAEPVVVAGELEPLKLESEPVQEAASMLGLG